MNEDDAKVPNDEKDWSIEVYLFANGQQFSPPRKYHLRASELNLWEDTLDQLAQSHYGQQCPLKLFTIDGQVVEGPLALRDGQAYVAVAEPDTFIDAGYQQYLMKASRSWEKRQARRKVKECVPDDPCCLCPEKEWCCDPQTCCQCPDKEDSFTQDTMMPATGQQTELRPSRGHYMSSASAKTDAATDYGPRSNRFRSTMDEHAKEKPNEYGVNADQIPKISENRARSNELGAMLGENTQKSDVCEANMNDRTPRLIETEIKPGEFGARTNENRPRLSKNGERSVDYEARLGGNAGRLSENAPRLSKNGAKLDEYGAKPGENAPNPVEYGTNPGEYETRPDANITTTSANVTLSDISVTRQSKYLASLEAQYDTKPVGNVTRPTDATKSLKNGARPGDNRARLGEHGTRLSNSGLQPSEPVGDNEIRSNVSCAKPGRHGAKPRQYGTKSGEEETKPIGNGHKTGQYGATTGDHDTISNLGRNKPDEYRAWPDDSRGKPSKNELRSGEDLMKPSKETQPIGNGSKTGLYGARQCEHETRSNVRNDKPDEYRTWSNDSSGKPIKSELRSAEDIIKSTEETKPIGNGSKTSNTGQYGARQGEHENRSNVSSNKPGEYRALPNDSKGKPSKSEIRSGEDVIKSPGETKLIGNGSKTGQYEARQVENETRSNASRVKPDENRAWQDDSGVKRGDSRGKSSKRELRSGEDLIKSSVNILKPGHIEPWSSESEPIKEEKSVTDLKAILDKMEHKKPGMYGETEGVQWNKQIESKGRANDIKEKCVSDVEQTGTENVTVTGAAEPKTRSENTHRPSEQKPPANEYKRKLSESKAEIEHTRRISGQRGSEIQSGGRTAERNREFEHGGRLSEQKGRENNFASRAVGQSAKENETRLSEQRNKQIDNLVRLNSHGGHENRANVLGMKTIDHDFRLRHPSPRVAEPSAKVNAPVSRPVTRDIINSKIRTSDLGQFKSGIPVSRVNETAAKLGESGIKNTVCNPVARPTSAGVNGAARAPHISETQQHTRKSSLHTARPSIEKKRLSIGQNSSLLKKPTPITSALKQPVKTNKDSLTKTINGKGNFVPMPASNNAAKSVLLPDNIPYNRITPPAVTLSTNTVTSQESVKKNRAPLENIIDEKEISIVSTQSLKQSESEIITSTRIDTVKHVIDAIENTPQETQTEVLYEGKFLASTSISVEVQTSSKTEELDTQQHAQKMSATNESATVNSGICCPCSQRNSDEDHDKNTVSILSKGDVINLKLNIEVRNIIKSVYSCAKNCQRSQSLTEIKRSEKESQITVDDHFLPCRDSLQSMFSKKFQYHGFANCSPNVMVVQCAGCGKLNNPPRGDTSQCCENNCKYYILLTSSVSEDVDGSCDFNPPCRPSEQRQIKKCSSIIPVKKSFSEIALDTVTTVTLSGIQRRETAKCNVINSSCQTDESQSDGMMTRQKVSITGSSVTTPAISLIKKQSCLKLCPEMCTEVHEDSHACSQTDPVPCDKVPSACSQTCPKVQSKGCQETGPPLQTEGCQETGPPLQTEGCQQTCPPVQIKGRQETCAPAQITGCQETCPSVHIKGCQQTCPPMESVASTTGSTTCPSRPVPLPCIQILTQVCPQAPHVRDRETQTQWRSLILQARLHCDGRYSFHLPPLSMLNHYPF